MIAEISLDEHTGSSSDEISSYESLQAEVVLICVLLDD